MRNIALFTILVFLCSCQAVPKSSACIRTKEEASKWRLMQVSPEEAFEMRKAAYRGFASNPEKAHEPEYWFMDKNGNALLCQPSQVNGCGTRLWEVEKLEEQWVSKAGEFTIRLCH